MSKAVNILFKGFGYNNDEIGQILTMPIDDVDMYIKLNTFARTIKTMLIRDNISLEKAKLLSKTNDSQIQKEIIEKVKEYNLNTEKTEIFVNSALKEKMQELLDKVKDMSYSDARKLIEEKIKEMAKNYGKKEEELLENPRSQSAKLRIIERVRSNDEK